MSAAAVERVEVLMPIDATLYASGEDEVRCAAHVYVAEWVDFVPIPAADLAVMLPVWERIGWGACDVCSGRAPF